MSPAVVNELEERRIVRLLGELADAVEPLPASDLRELVQAAPSAAPRRGERSRSFAWSRSLAAAAAACSVAIVGAGVLLPTEAERSQPMQRQAGTAGGLVAFPEGSALHLLITATDRA